MRDVQGQDQGTSVMIELCRADPGPMIAQLQAHAPRTSSSSSCDGPSRLRDNLQVCIQVATEINGFLVSRAPCAQPLSWRLLAKKLLVREVSGPRPVRYQSLDSAAYAGQCVEPCSRRPSQDDGFRTS
jgi:hypothetical protein